MTRAMVTPETRAKIADEEIRSPFDRGYMILLRGGMMRVNPGDYGYMVANAGSARPA